MAITNSDDHLRNHGFLLGQNGWRLSPLYDVNPVPYGDTLALNIDADDNTISLELAIDTAPYYGLTKELAQSMALEMLDTIRQNWQRLARKNGLTHAAMEQMRPAFTLCYETPG